MVREYMANIKWNTELANYGSTDGWSFSKNRLYKSMGACIPLKLRRASNQPIWMDQNTMWVIKKKRRLWNWNKTTEDHDEYNEYIKVQKLAAQRGSFLVAIIQKLHLVEQLFNAVYENIGIIRNAYLGWLILGTKGWFLWYMSISPPLVDFESTQIPLLNLLNCWTSLIINKRKTDNSV